MSIKETATVLQKQIDSHVRLFCDFFKQVQVLQQEIEVIEKKMASIALELEPVEKLVFLQNPKLENHFNSLKKVYFGSK